MSIHRLALLPAGFLYLIATAFGQSTDKAPMQDCPMHSQHTASSSQHAMVESHGDLAMGFSHQITTHHFHLSADGGMIQVTADNPNDTATIQAIRSHLRQITGQFRQGNFSAPMFVHDGIPPGITTMNLLKARIRYEYQDMSAGGRVRIESGDAVALAAIHDFLRFQISDHQTGDDPRVSKPSKGPSPAL